jgi:hypothetical protein
MGLWSGCFFIGTVLSPPIVTLVGKFAGTFLQTVAAVGAFCVVAAVVIWALGRRQAPMSA